MHVFIQPTIMIKVRFGSKPDIKLRRLQRPLRSGKRTSNALPLDPVSLRSANGREADIESKENLPENCEKIMGTWFCSELLAWR